MITHYHLQIYLGLLGIPLGGNYLDYNVLAGTPAAGQHLGILLVEFGVGITVAATMITIFFQFAGRAGEREAGE